MSLIHDSPHRQSSSMTAQGSHARASCVDHVPERRGWVAGTVPSPKHDRTGMNRNGSDVARRPYVLVAPGTVR